MKEDGYEGGEWGSERRKIKVIHAVEMFLPSGIQYMEVVKGKFFFHTF